MTNSDPAGTSRSQVTALVSRTGARRRKPANRNSSTVGGSGADAEYIDGGSAPIAMQTGIVSFRSAMSRQCAAPTLCRCQCMASSRAPNNCAIHADVADASLGIARDHHRQRDVWATVLRPALDDRQLAQVDLIAAQHDLLTGGGTAFDARRELPQLE